MKLRSKLTALLLAPAALAIISCGTASPGSPAQAAEGSAIGAAAEAMTSEEAAAHFAGAADMEWTLREVSAYARGERVSTVTLDRERLAREFGGLFTLRFSGGLAQGTGAPNTYRSPFALGDYASISFGPLATTRMGSLPAELVGLAEHDFFTIMENANRWHFCGDVLELRREAGPDSAATVLRFAPMEPNPPEPPAPD